MNYAPAILLLFAVAGCANKHELTSCKGPYAALIPPPPAIEPPKISLKAAPIVAPPILKPVAKQQIATQGAAQ